MAGSIGGPVVVPGDPDSSIIICKLEGFACGNRMPFLGTAWTQPMIDDFRTWITEGALDN